MIGFALLFIVPGFEYGVGSFERPGAGGYPVVVGGFMALFGLVIMVNGVLELREVRQAVRVDWNRVRHIAVVSGAIGVFAMTIERLGLLPATALVVVLAGLADRTSRLRLLVLLAMITCVIIWLIFKLGLSISTPLIEGVV